MDGLELIPVPAEVWNELARYLMERPYREVAGLLARMEKCVRDAAPAEQAE
jgi:hypothetical protein